MVQPTVKKGINALIKDAVKKCHKDTPKNSPTLDQCILVDQAMTSIATNVINRNYAKLHSFGRKPPSASDPYMTIDVEENRVKYYTSTPHFKNGSQLSQMDKFTLYDYFLFFDELRKLFIQRCAKNNQTGLICLLQRPLTILYLKL
ncbi:hypothetical protein [Commensalibacter nepenthis]|uniref:Uncharacterized protein n=1 Tax=Commensalibacter nepenthis TaxID=3043872 RepID=A0ABT6Q7H7_9PROT|nr:hypothetical protein [Commensalibacter sp. TBRC 10068]MDI2112305.1 hypothetical protein [Commensalibacter sp. TBRC 10068]